MPTDMLPSRVVRLEVVLSLTLVLLAAGLGTARAQETDQAKDKEEPKRGWSNTTDLTLVVTGGNSTSTSLGFTNELRYLWQQARCEVQVDFIRDSQSDDRFFLVEPGLEFPVGGAPSNPATSLIKPDPTLDAANSLIRGACERNISPKWIWNAGASVYRNDDAGIRNRYILFTGLGNTWTDNQRRRFVTSYGVSYTDREENDPDPEKDRRFTGARAGLDYTEHLTPTTTFDSDFAWNINFTDGSDFSINTVNALSVAVTNHALIKVSIQWLFENEPALESDLDVIAFVQVLNPDGIPGTGDERFRTLASGGTKLVLGSSSARKDKLDTIVRTALVIKF